MATEEEKDGYYHGINPDSSFGEDKAAEQQPGHPRRESNAGKSRGCSQGLVAVIAALIFCALIATALILIFFLIGNDEIGSGYNGFVEQESVNYRHSYFARLSRENAVGQPVHFDSNNPEFKDVDFSL
jgi:hypothetical protein